MKTEFFRSWKPLNAALVCCLLGALAGCESIVKEQSVAPGQSAAYTNNLADFGYDEGVVTFQALRAQGIDCVIHRITKGSRYLGRTPIDEDYLTREYAARSADMQWGAYHFIENTASIEDQIPRFLRYVKAVAIRNGTSSRPLLLVLDNERESRVTLSQLATGAAIIADRTGAYPGIYMNTPHDFGDLSELRREIGGLTGDEQAILKKCWLWVPNYGDRYQLRGAINLKFLALFGTWKMWQYAGDDDNEPAYGLEDPAFHGDVGGAFERHTRNASMRNFCDRSVFNGSKDDWLAFYQKNAVSVDSWKPDLDVSQELGTLR